MSRKRIKTFSDLLERTERNGDCINYVRSMAHRYGFVCVNGKRTTAHRASYEFNHGPIPGGLHVCHRCDNPRCVNPDHLFLGTQQQNMDDKVAKGRAHGPGRRLTPMDAQVIRAMAKEGYKQGKIAEAFRVTLDCVHKIIAGKRHAAPEMNWEHATL